MPWNKRNYPASMKNLPSVVRNKAIEIANALLKDGYEEGRAIAIAQDQAREWARNHGEAGHHERVHVEPHDRGWAVRSEDAQRAMKVYERKQDAIARGKSVAQQRKGRLVVHKPDGTIQEKHDYGQAV
ncbi:MAG TPA: DUF2188 domain-containing protein [Aggregatilineaceae bacterium]|nr:DUF2188 domain-containing protein [Anaerolineae bacterium]HMM27565.1 DUF2188 domain-containing protein [Aggregatilineaceae bacterium]HMM27612.1 DUF2188 domain-containing protein [Aggregatilineaceae bacterium]